MVQLVDPRPQNTTRTTSYKAWNTPFTITLTTLPTYVITSPWLYFFGISMHHKMNQVTQCFIVGSRLYINTQCFIVGSRLYVWYPRKLPLLKISRLWCFAGLRNCRFNIYHNNKTIQSCCSVEQLFVIWYMIVLYFRLHYFHISEHHGVSNHLHSTVCSTVCLR